MLRATTGETKKRRSNTNTIHTHINNASPRVPCSPLTPSRRPPRRCYSTTADAARRPAHPTPFPTVHGPREESYTRKGPPHEIFHSSDFAQNETNRKPCSPRVRSGHRRPPNLSCLASKSKIYQRPGEKRRVLRAKRRARNERRSNRWKALVLEINSQDRKQWRAPADRRRPTPPFATTRRRTKRQSKTAWGKWRRALPKMKKLR